MNPTTKVNQGYWDRWAKTTQSHAVTTKAPLMFDCLRPGLALPPGLRTSITLMRAPDGFALVSPSANGKNYRLEIMDIELDVTRWRLVDDLVDKIYSAWHDEKYISISYPRINPVGPFQVSTSDTLINRPIANGQRPQFIITFFVSAAAANGAFERNIFRFHHMNVNNLQFHYEDHDYPSKPFTPKFGKEPADPDFDVMREFYAFLQVMGQDFSNTSNGLNQIGWTSDNTLFCTMLNETQEVLPNQVNPLPETGQLSASMAFDRPPSEAMQLWFLCGYLSTIRISEDLTIGLDGNPAIPS